MSSKKTKHSPESLKKGVVVPPGFNSSFCVDTLLPLISMAYVRGFEAKYGLNRDHWSVFGKLEFAPLGEFKLVGNPERFQEIVVEQNLFFWEKGKKNLLPMGMWTEYKDKTILTFRGTLSAFEWYHDVLIRQVPSRWLPGKVHEGFKTVFKAMNPELPDWFSPNKPLIITGHSLGAAMATLAGYALKEYTPTVYLFGSPRVGSTTFQYRYNAEVPTTFRVENAFDIVTELPPEELYVLQENYKHVGKRVYVYADKNKLEDYKDLSNRDVLLGHFPSVYSKALKNMTK